jgi:hypothetical protein
MVDLQYVILQKQEGYIVNPPKLTYFGQTNDHKTSARQTNLIVYLAGCESFKLNAEA